MARIVPAPDLIISPTSTSMDVVYVGDQCLDRLAVVSDPQAALQDWVRDDPGFPLNPVKSHCLVHGIKNGIGQRRVCRYGQVTERHHDR